MSETKTYKFSLIRLISYSLITVSILVIAFTLYSGLNFNKSGENSLNYTLPSNIYISFFFNLLLISSLVLLLKSKIWAYYFIYALFGFLLVVIFTESPVDWLNAIVLIILLLIYINSHTKQNRTRKISSSNNQGPENNPVQQ